MATLTKLFVDANDLEAVLYHRIVRTRIAVIQKLADLVEDKARERFLQEHIFEHLWLLDPGWERATDAHMEQSMAALFDDLEQKAPEGERSSRLDIRYQRTSGIHVIVELKKAEVRTTVGALSDQIRKYRNALRTALRAAGRGHEGVAIVCLLGQPLREWDEENGRQEAAQQLAPLDARVMLYDELLANARSSYQAYLDADVEAGRVRILLDGLANE